MRASSDTKFSSTWVAGAVVCPQQHYPSEAACFNSHLSATDRCSDFTTMIHSSKLWEYMHLDSPHLHK